MSMTPSDEAKRLYWKKNLLWLWILLSMWFVVAFGGGVFFVDQLDRLRLPGTNMKLGFWISQQGSIYFFIVLIAIYGVVMNRLDRELMAGFGSEADRDS